jgi:cobalamin biosynthesis Mg chelatase CobN
LITGHWLGLTHTFAGATMNTTTGCDIYGGDEILDTPAQEDAGPLYCTERPCCNLEQDTCPHIPGTDPVWNFMDYSDDCCMSRFSSMQAEKMRFSWKLFRNDYMDTTSTATATATATATTNNNGNDDINNNNSTFASLAIDFIADSSGDDDNTADVSGGSASATTTTTTVFTNNSGISMSDIVAVVAAISMIMSSFL